MWKLSVISLVFCFLAIEEAVELETIFSEEYGPFNETNNGSFAVVGDATISEGGLRLTTGLSGSLDPAVTRYETLTSRSGRILMKRPFKLWEDNATTTASFNTSFLINVNKNNSARTGEGFAFVIAPDLLVPPNSGGQFLGLMNSGTWNGSGNNLVAVEFDTKKQDYDPDDNHVGIDLNTMRSMANASLTPIGITLASQGDKFYSVWVDYDGINNVIDVYIVVAGGNSSTDPPKPAFPILSSNLTLSDYVSQFSYLGFSASMGDNPILNTVLRWKLTVKTIPRSGKKNGIYPGMVVGIGVAALLLVVVVLAMFVCLIQKQRALSANIDLVEALKRLSEVPKEFRFRDLKKATGNFDEKNKLGQGGFGVVYRGVLLKENMEIAVKRFSRESIKSQHDFLAELSVINRLRHKHLVKLLGWCHKNRKLVLVYEYMPNGSLDQHLFVGAEKDPLEWNLRLKIITGVASALRYLHNEYDKKVIHRDLKASNIMLDSDFNARLGDFGLAKVLENEKTSYAEAEAEGVVGTMGYIAPECLLTGKATRQSDIYALGGVLLEVVCGKWAGTKIAGFNFLVDWVWMMHRDGKLVEAVDQRLGDNYVKEEAEMLLLLGLACSHPNGSERPKTDDLLHIISGTMPVPVVPPFKPAFVWPSGADLVNAERMDSIISITVSDLAR